MNGTETPDVVVVGSIAFDSIETPAGKRPKLMGGSASYTATACALLARTGLVGVVGGDFPEAYLDVFRGAGVDLAGLERVADGKTFHWDGTYDADMNNRTTNCTELNVFADFDPVLPEAYRKSPCLCLGNIAPALQAKVLDQMEAPRFTLLDTMNLWIDQTRDDLMKVIPRVDMLIINEHETRELTGKDSLLRGARDILAMGPRYALVKKGEHGAFLMGRDFYAAIPAWPLERLADPTGAGDTFSAGIVGTVAAAGNLDAATLKQALVNATCLASFTCEAFGIERLKDVTKADLAAREAAFRAILP
jgi:sugar/nucleoside kinase (ribokinase family)